MINKIKEIIKRITIIKFEPKRGLSSFQIRSNDICEECKTPLLISGIKEMEDEFYEVVVYCKKCKDLSKFYRIKKDRIETEQKVDKLDKLFTEYYKTRDKNAKRNKKANS